MFIYQFLISNILTSFAILMVFVLKAVLKNRISAKQNYYMWFFVIFLMLAAFVPNLGLNYFEYTEAESGVLNNNFENTLNLGGGVKDLYVSVKKHYILYYIWLFGCIIGLFRLVLGIIGLKKILGSKKESELFNLCRKKVGVRADLYLSPYVSSPLSFGIIKPAVVMPDCLKISAEQAEHIILHELIHHKHGDIFINYIICLLGALYWFNPLICIMTKIIKRDMEIYCDYSVIEHIGDNIGYGKTILSLAEQKTRIKYLNYFANQNADLKIRIGKIADFNKEYSPIVWKGSAMAMTVLAFVFFVIINSYGYCIDKPPLRVEAEYVDLSAYFKNCEGCFALYDTDRNRYTVYNKNMAERRASPNSTYKIAMALNGLENGLISEESNNMEWDGTENYFDEWNKRQNLNSAMKYSVNWYFQSIDKKMGRACISKFLHKTHYGNMRIGFDVNGYWLEDCLKISAVEQVEFLKNIYNNRFCFDEDAIKCVLNSVKISDGFYGKTGTGMVNGKTVNGWFVGMILRENNPYIFAARISAKDNADGLRAEKITERILEDLL